MPKVTFKSVREVSSEDPNYKAENLLKQTPGKSWKTKTVGDKQAYVILELECPVQITGIDIGNEHSAFIEVLVGKAACTNEDFKEILVTCSFMTPFESRGSENTNRVRCFTHEALVPSVASEKWQMIKIICTQPFNKHVQYGVAFIKLHVAESNEAKSDKPKSVVPEKFLKMIKDAEKNKAAPTPIKKIGKFTLREESPDSESESSNALFQRWKTTKTSTATATTTAAAIRDAASPAALKKMSETPPRKKFEYKPVTNARIDVDLEEKRLEVRDRNRMDLLFGDEEECIEKLSPKKQRLSKHIEQEQERVKHQNEVQQLQNKKTKSSNDDKPSTSKASVAPKRHSSPPQTSAVAKKPKITQIHYRPFNQLLKGVILVISGIQNPDRANLREKALKMGAKYRADWEPSCTHLISAFKNTPKYKQVKGKGKIITKNWIEDCYRAKKYLPWRRFALDTDDEAAGESDVELWDESLKPEEHNNSQISEKSTMGIEDLETSSNPICNITSDDDTEDELERIRQKQKNTQATQSDNTFDVTTEEEDYLTDKNKQVSTKLNFFANTLFYLHHDVNVVGKIKLETIIQKYGGQLTKDLRKAQYAVTENGFMDPSNTVDFTGVAVQPRWIYECNDLEIKVPTQRYLI